MRDERISAFSDASLRSLRLLKFDGDVETQRSQRRIYEIDTGVKQKISYGAHTTNGPREAVKFA